MVDWQRIADIVNERVHERCNKMTAKGIETLVGFHGWEVIGPLMDALDSERRLRLLVEAGVPFDETNKIVRGRSG